MPEAVERIAQLRAALPESIHIQVDGGIDQVQARTVYEAGATLLVAGTAIFGREDLQRAYRQLVHELA
jgi:ribulose-phosphate 3-epimerase